MSENEKRAGQRQGYSYASAFGLIIASNQAMSVIVPARVMEQKRRELDIPEEEFAGALMDSGAAAAGVIPWNVMAAICSESLQCPSLALAPYAVLIWSLPLAGATLILLESTRSRRKHHASTPL